MPTQLVPTAGVRPKSSFTHSAAVLPQAKSVDQLASTAPPRVKSSRRATSVTGAAQRAKK